MVKSMAFQLTAEKVDGTYDLVKGMFFIYYSLLLFLMLMIHVVMCRGVLSEKISYSTRSFLSLALNKRFDDAPGELEFPLEVKIVGDHPMSELRFHRGCVLELFLERFPIDLVHIPMHESRVILSMDWLRLNEEMIDFENQLVQV